MPIKYSDMQYPTRQDMRNEIGRLRKLLTKHAAHTMDCRWQWEHRHPEGNFEGTGTAAEFCDCGFIEIWEEFLKEEYLKNESMDKENTCEKIE